MERQKLNVRNGLVTPEKKIVFWNYLSQMYLKTYVVGTQKNHLIEMVLLSYHSKCFERRN